MAPGAAEFGVSSRFDSRRYPGLGSAARLAFVFLYAPLAVVIIYSFNGGQIVSRWESFSFDWYREVLDRDDVREAVWTSLRVAVTASAGGTALAILAALGIVAMLRRGSALAVAFLSTPLLVPEIVTAVGTLSFFVLVGLERGMATLILAHTAFCVPFALLPIRARLAELDPAIFEAASDLGASGVRLFRRVTLPLLVPGIVSGTLLAFIISLDDYLISAFDDPAASQPPPPPATVAEEPAPPPPEPAPPAAEPAAPAEAPPAPPEAPAETDAGEAADTGQIGGELNLYNWTDYISEDLLSRFSEETGIAVNLSNYDSNETMLATLAAGATGYDVIVPSDYIIPQLIEQDLIQPIDAFAMENAANIDPAFLTPYFDDGRVYTAPYLYGTTGLAVDTSQVPEPPASWAEFFAVPEGSDGSIGMMNDQIEVIHAVLRAVGAQPCSTDPADYAQAEDLLDAFKPSVSVINSDGIIERMASGENSIHMEWNGAAYRSSLENPNLVYVYPSDGLTLWQDNFAVPTGAPNLEQAKVFINWMMDPQNIAEATNWNAYGNAIVGSDAYVEDKLASSPMVVPSAQELSYAAPVETCPLEATDLYDRLWTSFRS